MVRGHSGRWASTFDKREDVGGVYFIGDSPQIGDKRYVKRKCLIQQFNLFELTHFVSRMEQQTLKKKCVERSGVGSQMNGKARGYNCHQMWEWGQR